MLKKECHRTGGVVARFGGDEFVVILPSINFNKAMMLADKICQSITGLKIPHPLSKVSNLLTVSIGVASFQQEEKYNPQKLTSMADKALYIAKKNGRNQAAG